MFKDMDIQAYRDHEKRSIDSLPNFFESIPLKTYVEKNIIISGRKTRFMVYYPSMKKNETLPVFVNLHGGGFVLGFAEVDDVYCKLLTEEVHCIVVNMDYVLAPENKFPAALEECYQLMKWIYKNPGELGCDPQRLGIGGHSAGGNLAASVCLLAKERNEFAIKCQIIDYAVLDLATSPKAKKPISPKLLSEERAKSLAELAEKYNDWYMRTSEDGLNPLASPLLAKDLAGLPPALVIAAENDVLNNEDQMYAKRLKEAGVNVQYKLYKSCDHGFTHTGPRKAARDAWMQMAAFLRNNLHNRLTEKSR
jgi:acetyl esterase